jgi:4-diphosphocytidyl-2-C-methyl-D-erythritol kinase
MIRLGATTRVAGPITGQPAFFAGRDAVVLAAPAKLNLYLEILRKRPDNYHELESLMVAVNLFDTLEIRATQSSEIRLVCEPATLSVGPDNLVHKAATALRNYAKNPQLSAEIRLTKRIPTQAGLGGGSSDAAAALVGCNEIWKLGLTREELHAIAASIGSDVAFFLSLPAAWCTGRGEVTTPELSETQANAKPLHFVLVFPPVGVSTAEVYKRLAVPAKPENGDRVRAAFRNRNAQELGSAIFNRLEELAFAIAPLVGQIRKRLHAINPAGAMMSGSGSTVFAPCDDSQIAQNVARVFVDSRPTDEPESRVIVVRVFTP